MFSYHLAARLMIRCSDRKDGYTFTLNIMLFFFPCSPFFIFFFPLYFIVTQCRSSLSVLNHKLQKVSAEEKPKSKTLEKFSKGTPIEVSSDEDGFQGAWFGATIIEPRGEDKYLIEYQNLRTEDDLDFLREEIDTLHIRPRPPETVMVDRYNKFDEVDALYNDGWWVGVISKVLVNSRYIVYFKDTDEELEFEHSQLRLHKDWIDGKWVIPSRVCVLPK